MIQDTQLLLAGTLAADGTRSGQAITATAISMNIVDLRNGAAVGADEALGQDAWLVVQALGAAAGGDAAKTLTITLESDSASSLASAPVVHVSSPAILGSAIVAGAQLFRIPLPSADYKRYLGLRFTVSAGFTSFPVTAFLTPNGSRNTSYRSAVTLDT